MCSFYDDNKSDGSSSSALQIDVCDVTGHLFVLFFFCLATFVPFTVGIVFLVPLQEIDGRALLLLRSDMMMKYMGLKLGPALKLTFHIDKLKRP